MDFDATAIGDQSEIWGWHGEGFDLQKDLLADPSSSLWVETINNVDDAWSMFDEKTPVKHCADIDFQFCDVGEIVVKDFDEGRENIQAKRRRMLQFRLENVEIEYPMMDVLSKTPRLNSEFSSDECLLHCDEIEDLPEQWLVSPPEEMNTPNAVAEKVDISAQQKSSPQEQSDLIEKKPLQARPTPLKAIRFAAGRNVIRARKLAAVAYPFELIKPCGFHGDVTLSYLNQKIHAPPPYKIKHKSDDEQPVLQLASAISSKPVVHKTMIHTEGGKGTITITRTRG